MGGPYVIKGELAVPGWAGTHKSHTARDAIIKAMELMSQGMRNVCIVDAQGNVYKRADFPRLMASDGR